MVNRARAAGGQGAEAFVRQLCWRDFHHQVLAARPEAAARDYHARQDRWRTGGAAEEETEAWKEGRTGYPVVDAAMRQLRHEGWMHNRGRLLAASFLTKTLYVDWRTGARHFLDLLVDGDLANNRLNWQWAAGTGTDPRPAVRRRFRRRRGRGSCAGAAAGPRSAPGFRPRHRVRGGWPPTRRRAPG